MIWRLPLCCGLLLVLHEVLREQPSAFAHHSATSETTIIEGVVRDESGSVLDGVQVELLDSQKVRQYSTESDAQGRFSIRDVRHGSYMLTTLRKGFAEGQRVLHVGEAGTGPVEIVLLVRRVHSEVTVSAVRGQVEDRLNVSQAVNTISQSELDQRAKSVLAQAAQEEPGLALQRTSPTMSGIFVRGLTGAKVNVFVDGVRYSTGAQRGGVNTFFNLVDPSIVESMEVLRGPNSAQYGSDSIGGTVQILTRPARYGSAHPLRTTFTTFFNSADVGFGSNLVASYGLPKFGVLANVTGRRVSTLRSGHGLDSHSALTRFLGIPSTVLYHRNPDTAFTQYGGLFRMSWTPRPGTSLTGTYMRDQQDGGKRFDQLLGGDGNLVAELRNLTNDFLYARLDRTALGFFDQVNATYSYNVQREERVNQGGQGNPRAAITHEPERLRAHGANASAAKAWNRWLMTILGMEYYHERIAAPSFQEDPVTNTTSVRRGRVPDNALYKSGGVYLDGIFELVPRLVRLNGALRYSAASYRARAGDSPRVGGQPLWPDDSVRASDWTGRIGGVIRPADGLSLVLSFSRGFRAPNITDLGTVGLTGNGFEVAAPDVAGRGATVGDSAGSAAVSTGMPVEQVEPEHSWTREFGVRYRKRALETEITYFATDFYGNIEKFALILPPGAVGTELGGQTINAQNANGVVFVPAAANPVLVRANQGDASFYGFEHDTEWRFGPGLAAQAVLTYLRAKDRKTGLAPNIEGGTPAPDFWLKLRYMPSSKPLWVEPYFHGAARQDRLSSLDLVDRRTGAERTRASIQNFFGRGATVRGLISPGSNGIFGNADDILIATGETLALLQDRVLGPGINSSSLFYAVPGYAVFGIRGGLRFGEYQDLLLDLENIGDRNYRGISWGIDAPGRSLSFRYTVRF